MATDEGESSHSATVARTGTCDSCGLDAEDLAAVRRVYLDADESGELRVADTAEEIEWWCGPCRSHYPHVEGEPAAHEG
jgi:hypothetical protein